MTFDNARHADKTVRSLIDRLTARIVELEQKLEALEELEAAAASSVEEMNGVVHELCVTPP
jgi:phage shock protein A